jgi:hypothetical protein
MWTNWGGYEVSDIRTVTMLLALRCISVSVCYKDGATDPIKLSSRQQLMAIKHVPSIIEMTSYTFYHSQSTVAVMFEFKDFQRFIEMRGEYESIPSTLLPSLKLYCGGLIAAVINLAGERFYDMEIGYKSEFGTWSTLYQVYYIWIVFFVKRNFYYTPFLWNQASIVASGFGYNGLESGQEKWDKVVGTYIWDVETCTNLTEFSNKWNWQVA